MECFARLIDHKSGRSDEYALGVLAKTGLTPLSDPNQLAPGYDYVVIFSKSHVFTKRSHASSYFNNPTVLEHADFGMAQWRLQRMAAQPLASVSDIRRALENWQELSAVTRFDSGSGSQSLVLEYPVKWADVQQDDGGFRVETGPVFLLDPDRVRVGEVPEFTDFQWAHLDYRSFDRVRCLLERPTSLFADAQFQPPAEHHRQFRENPPLSREQVESLEELLFRDHAPLPASTMRKLFETDHYSQAEERAATTALFALPV
jgi:hypothetical protein